MNAIRIYAIDPGPEQSAVKALEPKPAEKKKAKKR